MLERVGKYLWAGLMLAMSIQVGSFSVPPTTSPIRFVLMVSAATILNLLLASIIYAASALITTKPKAFWSGVRELLTFTGAWVLASVIQLIVVYLVAGQL